MLSKGKRKFLVRVYRTIAILNEQQRTGNVDLFAVASLYTPLRKKYRKRCND